MSVAGYNEVANQANPLVSPRWTEARSRTVAGVVGDAGRGDEQRQGTGNTISITIRLWQVHMSPTDAVWCGNSSCLLLKLILMILHSDIYFSKM